MDTSRASTAHNGMDPITDLLGGERPVYFRPCLARIAGSAAAGVLLSQFWFWSNNRAAVDREGWFYKTMKEIESETALTRTEQETARRRLRDLGILEEDKRGLPMKIWFRLNKKKLSEKLRGYAASNLAEIPQDWLRDSCASSCRVSARLDAAYPQDIDEAKNTAEITAAATRAHTRAKAHQTPAAAFDFEESAFVPEPPSASKADPGLTAALTVAGVNRKDAEALAAAQPDECHRQLEFLSYVSEFRTSRGAYLVSAIRGGYAPPPAYEKAQEERRLQEQKERAARAREAKDNKRRQEEAAREAAIAAARVRLEADPQAWAQVLAEAEERLPQLLRGRPDRAGYRPALEKKLNEVVLRYVE